MPDLRLSKLPDRTPVKISISVTPHLNAALTAYAEIYRATYGEVESVAELIPFMLGAFLDGDRGFAKARKEIPLDALPEPERRRRRRRPAPQLASTTSTEE